jgi:pimeloyl-ACP methyl ester carboxylesterase
MSGAPLVNAGESRYEAIRFAAPGRTSPRAPLIFLHEGLGSAAHWRDFPQKAAERTGRDAVAYSRLGYGHSDPVPLPRPLDYMERDARESLPRVLEALVGATRDVVLFGHSDGASIALLYAAASARASALVLEAPHVFVEDVSVASIAKARDAYAHGDLRARLERYHDANVDVAFRGWNEAWLDPGFRSWNIEACLREIRVPVLLLQGEDDAYGTRAQVDAIARQAPGPVMLRMLPRCGHAPHRDQPEAVLSEVTAFLEDVP